jgi:carbamoyltransferase
MLILSVHLGHNSSICLLDNGNVEKYFLIERFTRKKYDYNKKVILNLVNTLSHKLKEKLDILCVSNFKPQNGDETISTIFEVCKKYNPNVKLVLQQDHHLNHASIAFYNSKFDESLVVVADGSGSEIKANIVEVESVFIFNRDKNTLIYKKAVDGFSSFDFPWGKVGVGGLYDMASVLIGNTPDDCGKAMGLSSYGSSNKLFDNLILQQNPEIKPIKKVEPDNYQLHADFCYEVQQQTQKIIGDLIEDSIQKTGIKKVCISGGYGMNVVANYYYLRRFPDVEFYFEPICNDNGVSIGAAMNSYFELTGKIPNPIETSFFHGTCYDVSSYKGKTTSIKNIANLLDKNKSVAVYTKLAESGQRALGNRSIFFNALNPDAKDIVNKIKKREWYRPFACVVLEEDASIYFDMGKIKSSPFMTICFPVRTEYVRIIPGVTHVDNTCRIQTVSKNDGYLYELLQEFKKLSGHGILLNTSLNLAGQPLVETPTDALNTLINSHLEYLWFEETHQLYGK